MIEALLCICIVKAASEKELIVPMIKIAITILWNNLSFML